jgi:hypothetical protein
MKPSAIIGILHLGGMVAQNLYGFFPRHNQGWDTLYVIFFVSVPLSWAVCKDECIVSYLAKKIQNPHYRLGSEPENATDMSDLFLSQSHYFYFYNANNFLRLCSLVIVNRRTTNINFALLIPIALLCFYYNYDIAYRWNTRKKLFCWVHSMFFSQTHV